jgi:lysophospholipase L1-like esterase
MDQTADMVIVYGGVNDYIHGDAPFGEIGDTIPTTYCGGVYFLMNYLRETYKDKPIIFMTPARCYLRLQVDDLIPSTHAAKRIEGKPLKAYVDAILEIAKQFDVKVLNLYDDLGIDPHIPEQFEKYTMDGLHFNDEGHALLAERLEKFIEAL